MSKEVVLVFDIGKTHKKILVFDSSLRVVHEEEDKFPEVPDDDGFMGDDIDKIEEWILETCKKYIGDPDYLVRGINFTTYGATLVYLDESGNRLTPVYNYLKSMPEGVVEPMIEQHGGMEEFCRKTASPALGMLNSGLQAVWLQKKKPEIYSKVRKILHFPQYLSYFLTGKVSSEHTSIGCHTALWDFDQMKYHDWTGSLGNVLPEPEPVETVYPSIKLPEEIPVGIGIHDSSSSLVPYFMKSNEEFILISTGTWCISMNPFNHSPLTPGQLQKDCLAYMSVQRKPVKSSRLFMGHIHDVNVNRLAEAFSTENHAYQKVKPDPGLMKNLDSRTQGERIFFKDKLPENYIDETVDPAGFESFEAAYHQLMHDLTGLTIEAIYLVTDENNGTGNLFITGGFSKNPVFLALLAGSFPEKKVYTSEIPNATSLGAAIVLWKALEPGRKFDINLGLKLIDPGSKY
jgi:sugar (pentulose or hexulose) kinase